MESPPNSHVIVFGPTGAGKTTLFGTQFVEDIVNRTQVAQNQAAALLATELVLKGQKNARIL
jgi:ABC-type cobalamin/Fe3+-siderophores transport system ATPase subunit